MSLFCTRCGTRNDAAAAFCEGCGTPMTRKAATPLVAPALVAGVPAGSAQVLPLAMPAISRRLVLLAGGAIAALLVVAGGVAWWLQPPKATPDRLLAAARTFLSPQQLEGFRQQLCVANTDYRASAFNAGPYDQQAQAWFNTLVTAGLYNAPTQVPGGFLGNLLQYTATPELAKYREGGRLCVAKTLEVAAVTDIREDTGGKDPRAFATVVLRATQLAPWMAQDAVHDSVLRQLSGWTWKDGTLLREVPTRFLVRDRAWAVGTGATAPDLSRSKTAPSSTAAATGGPGLFERLGQFFSFGGNPIRGAWRAEPVNVMGFRVPTDALPVLTFTNDGVDIGGAHRSAKFQVDGKRVTVTPEGEAAGMVFVLEGDDTLLFEATGMRYTRVR